MNKRHNNKKSILTLVLSILVLLILLLHTGNNTVLARNINTGDYFGYTVYDSNNTVNAFYTADYQYKGDWSVAIGDEIWFNISQGNFIKNNSIIKITFFDVVRELCLCL